MAARAHAPLCNCANVYRIKLTIPRLRLICLAQLLHNKNVRCELTYNRNEWIREQNLTVIAYLPKERCLQTFMECLPDYVSKERLK